MPFVQFVRDYQGTITNNVFYQAGTVVDLPGRMSYALRTEGVVVKVDAVPVETTTGAAPSTAPVVDVPRKPAKLGQGTKPARKRATKKTVKH